MILTPDFKEFLQSLNDNDVRYLVVGGYAVAFHGHPRFTKDIDIWIWVDEQNAANLIQALDQFGFTSLGLAVDDFLEPDIIVQLGYPPNRVDLITGLKGVEFTSNSRSFSLLYSTENQILGQNVYENHFYFSRGAGIAGNLQPVMRIESRKQWMA